MEGKGRREFIYAGAVACLAVVSGCTETQDGNNEENGQDGGGILATPTPEESVLDYLLLRAEYDEADAVYEGDRRLVHVMNGGLDIEAVCVQDTDEATHTPNPARAGDPCSTISAEEENQFKEDKYTYSYAVGGPGRYAVTVFLHDDKDQLVVDREEMSEVVYGLVEFEGGEGTVLEDFQLSPIDG